MAWTESASQPAARPLGYGSGPGRIHHVKVCIPHWGEVTVEWARHTLARLDYVAQPDFEKQVLLLRGVKNLDTERNLLVEEALKEPKTTHLFWVDTDTIFESPEDPNQALRMLLACDAPIASGLYRARQRIGFYYAAWKKLATPGEYTPVQGWTQGSNWIKVDAIGFGCVLVKREVFEKIPAPWFVWNQASPSEDFFFCEKAAKHGYEVRVLTDVKCSHVGVLKVKADGSVTTLAV